jgi:hypothetical protein
MKTPAFSFRRISLTFVALLATSASLLAEDKVTLKTQWKQGKVYTMSQTMKQAMEMGDQGNMDMDMDFTYGIKSMAGEADGDTKLALHFEKMDMKMKMKMAGQDMIIDTKDLDNPQGKAMRQQLEPILNAELVAIMGKDGELKDVNGLESVAGGAGGPMGQMFNKDMFSQTLAADKMYGFPSTPVGKGDKWKLDHQMDLMKMKMKITGDAEVKDVAKVDGKDIATLRILGVITLDSDALTKAIKEAAKAEGKGAGDVDEKELEKMMPKIKDIKMDILMKFNATDGYAVSTTGDTDVEMSMKAPDKQMDMKIKQKIDATVKMEDAK